jgi:hypothetical protein
MLAEVPCSSVPNYGGTWPRCLCAPGFRGTVSWSTISQSYEGICVGKSLLHLRVFVPMFVEVLSI